MYCGSVVLAYRGSADDSGEWRGEQFESTWQRADIQFLHEDGRVWLTEKELNGTVRCREWDICRYQLLESSRVRWRERDGTMAREEWHVHCE